MNQTKKIFTNIILLIVLLSCNGEKERETKNIDFFPYEISRYHDSRKIMDLYVKFSECGEWGGHEEKIFIITQNDANFHLTYQKYCVDCEKMMLIEDSLGSYNAPLKKLIDSCTIIMTEKQKKSIYDFSHNLLSAKFREEFPGHAGDNFYLKKYKGFSGDEFSMSFYGFDSKLLSDYNQLIIVLALPNLNNEEEANSCDN